MSARVCINIRGSDPPPPEVWCVNVATISVVISIVHVFV